MNQEYTMTTAEREMFEKSFRRPANYFRLSHPEQWGIDAALGILDWSGKGMSEDDLERFQAHYAGKAESPDENSGEPVYQEDPEKVK